MSVLLISYDLRKPAFDYRPLYAELATLKSKHVQDCVWGIRTDDSPERVFDQLWKKMHSERDRLLVVTFDKTKSFKSMNAMRKLSEL